MRKIFLYALLLFTHILLVLLTAIPFVYLVTMYEDNGFIVFLSIIGSLASLQIAGLYASQVFVKFLHPYVDVEEMAGLLLRRGRLPRKQLALLVKYYGKPPRLPLIEPEHWT